MGGSFAPRGGFSQVNPERDWGKYVLQSIQFAFWALNEKFDPDGSGTEISKHNTLVIASSVSNGGGSSIRAAEDDTTGLIDGVAVSEPNVNPIFSNHFVIKQEREKPVANHTPAGVLSPGQKLASMQPSPLARTCSQNAVAWATSAKPPVRRR